MRAPRPLLLLQILAFLILVAACVLALRAPTGTAASTAPSRAGALTLTVGDRGRAACDAKWLLAGHNAFKVRTLTSSWTGGPDACLYGPRAAAATRKMKWELGYPTKLIDDRFGPNLRAFLIGDVKLPPLFVTRRAARHPIYVQKTSYPLARRAAVCGTPGVGTHSFSENGFSWQDDNAIDLCVTEGTPILAVRPGTMCNKLGALHPGSSGRYAGIRGYLCSDDGNRWFYTHMRGLAPGIRLGVRVHAGQTIGYVGVAGIAHLHVSCEWRTCHSWSTMAPALGISTR